MATFLDALLSQVSSYIFIVLIFIMFVSLLLRGFFWKYLKVRTSFGRLVMVKIRTAVRDYLEIGIIDEGFLIYKHKDSDKKKNTIRITLPKDKIVSYKFLGITYIDVDEEKNAICTVDYSCVDGYDAKKLSDLHTRALERPTVNSNKEKIMIFLMIIIIVLTLVGIFLGYQNYKFNQGMPQLVTNALTAAKGTVTPAGGI